MKKTTTGFTIVELLIVIIVIAVLAAITIVAYNGIQQRARASEASTALNQAKKKLALYKVDNSSYPTTGNLSSAGITDSTVTFQYTSDGSTYCLTATAANVSYKATDTTSPNSGGCGGHGQGGVAAVTNMVLDPRATGSNWFTTIGGTVTRTFNVSWSGKTNWARHVSTSSGYSNARLYVNESDLIDGETYTISFLVGNDGSSPVAFSIDFCDSPSNGYSVAPGEQKRVSLTASRADYTSIYRFVDLSISTTSSSGLLITDGMVTKGTTGYTYADGTSPNWIWNGTANNSTSTGPAL